MNKLKKGFFLKILAIFMVTVLFSGCSYVEQYYDNKRYEKVRSYADSIEDNYGVAIFMGEEVNADFEGITFEPITYIGSMERALEFLEKNLKKYPQGFFEQMKGDEGRAGVELYLVGSMEGYGSTLANPAAVTYRDYQGSKIVINSYVIDETSIHHELAHAIDSYMILRWDPAYSLDQWISYNPEDFKYLEDYNGEWENDRAYTLSAYYAGDGDLSEVYFVSDYSKINVFEDVATIFEYVMTHPEDGDFYQAEHIINKLNYLSKALRSLFDSSSWPEVTAWEKGL